ncbi:hypothetical protein [Fodinicola acaciae]|uniref:hypothetical protein n=1 Tax=Fodinicola acaciae TaxID=2681555 RepID=UPI0013D68C4F|nr:hypothetical protein [Fodinicola acaciae]
MSIAMRTLIVGVLLAALTACSATPLTGLTDAQALQVAEDILLRGCLRKLGFDFIVTDPRTLPQAREFPYVIDDVAWARQHGYGTDIQRAQDQARRNDPNAKYVQSLSSQRQAALLAAENGPSPSGLTITTVDGLQYSRNPHSCSSQAQQQLYGDLAGWFGSKASMDSIKYLRITTVQRDPAFLQAGHTWSACMQRSGYHYANPAAIRAAPPGTRTKEVQLAVAEATCASSSGLSATAASLDKHYDEILRTRYRGVVTTYERLRTNALPRARSIVQSESIS